MLELGPTDLGPGLTPTPKPKDLNPKNLSVFFLSITIEFMCD